MPAYSEIVLDHFQNPRNLGDGIGVLDLAEGCPAAIAAASMTTVLLTGMTVGEALALRDTDVAQALGGLPPNKVHCSVLAEEVIQAALARYVPPVTAVP
ncbi:MAG: hypothetical protein EBU62_12350 [Proteobacteria bacterium]|nr:hypothetical protein [Pseudomonadota bacterium]